MKTIYKYLPDNFVLEEHLKSPELKLSLINSLNDPYEGKMTKNAIDKFSNAFLKHSEIFIKHSEEYGCEESKALAIFSIESALNNTCITSFSETQRNLLMWAHYSAQHKGVCIGYGTDVLKDENSDATLKKVNYDDILYDQEHFDEIESMKSFDSDETSSFCYRLFTTKSNDWAYEKEHRFISSCETASRIIVNCPYEKLSPEAMMAVSLAESKKTHKIIRSESCTEIYNLRNKEEQIVANKNGNELETILADNHNPLFLKRIGKRKIKSIYLGMFFDDVRENEILNIIKNDQDLVHINVYRYTISDERYELKSQKLHPIPEKIINK